MQILKQIFDKKSPLFIITIAMFIVSIIARGEPLSHSCHLSSQIQLFEILLIISTGIQIVSKTIVIEILNKCCTSAITAIHNVIVIVFILTNLAIYSWSIHMYFEIHKYKKCIDNEPHTFFIKVYCCLYTVINLVLAITLISLKFQNKTMTVFDPEQNFEIDRQL